MPVVIGIVIYVFACEIFGKGYVLAVISIILVAVLIGMIYEFFTRKKETPEEQAERIKRNQKASSGLGSSSSGSGSGGSSRKSDSGLRPHKRGGNKAWRSAGRAYRQVKRRRR